MQWRCHLEGDLGALLKTTNGGLRWFTPYFIFVAEKGQTEQKNRPNKKEPRGISWEKMTKLVNFLKIEVIKEMTTKI